MNKKKLVVIGGGSGLSNLLRGIKKLDNVEITALVTIADNSGSTGAISQQFKIPAVGDLRRVISSLSLERDILEKSMEFRFENTGTPLDGHTIGNLILTSQVLKEGDFSKGIEMASRMLNIQGKVLPISNNFSNLKAEYTDGSVITGEWEIGHSKEKIKRVFYDEDAVATKTAVDSLLEADYIIFGIGSLYTSLLANLVYPKIKKALVDTKATVIYFSNVWTQHGETDGMTLSDHIKAIEEHTHENVIDKIIVSNTVLSKEAIDSYEDDNQSLIEIDRTDVIAADLVSTYGKSNNVKHDELKILSVLEDIIK